MNEQELCIDCKKVNTSSRYDGLVVCASCCNTRYFKELSEGKIVEIKFRLSEYSQGTLEEIRYVLAKNKKV